jgi:hypothetical protein
MALKDGTSSTGMATAPTNEHGRDIPSLADFVGMMPWGQWIDDVERAPDLKWPNSITIYDQMRNDSQCMGLYLGATAAIQRYVWYLDPNECDPNWCELLAADLNLHIGLEAAVEAATTGQKRGRLLAHQKPNWMGHLSNLLHAMQYGFYYFEMVGEITNDGPGGQESWRLRKLGPRHPRTITEFVVNKQGELISIKQGYGDVNRKGVWNENAYEISAEHLVKYIWDGEPGYHVGRSIFRSMYRNWLIKDRLLRVDAIKHERNGVGMPVIVGPEGASPSQLQDLDKMAQEYKVGERGGGALPFGSKLTLQGTQGALPNTVASIKLQNEEMARSMLMMFMQLGQTETGSRALGRTFIDWFTLQQEMIAEWVITTANEELFGYWWRMNVDAEAEQAPQIAYFKPESEGARPNDFGGADLPTDQKEQKPQQEPGAGQDERTPAGTTD